MKRILIFALIITLLCAPLAWTAPKFAQSNFSGGEISPKLLGRFDTEIFSKSVEEMENWIPYSFGPVTTRPGTIFVNTVEDQTKSTRLVSFYVAEDIAYVLEFGDESLRVYRDDGSGPGIVAVGTITTPYDSTDVFELQFAQSVDVMYIAHPDYAPQKITRISDTEWNITTVGFDPVPTTPSTHTFLRNNNPLEDVDLSATTGENITITFSPSNTDLGSAEVGSIFVAGAGRALITHKLSLKVFHGDVIQEFDKTSYEGDEWYIIRERSLALDISGDTISGGVAFFALNAATTTPEESLCISTATDTWNLNSSGVAGFKAYLDNGSSGYTGGDIDLTTEPLNVYENGYRAQRVSVGGPGGLGNLVQGSWDYGDFDGLGYNTVYFNPSDTAIDLSSSSPDDCFVMRGYDDEREAFTFLIEQIDSALSRDDGNYLDIDSGFVEIINTQYMPCSPTGEYSGATCEANKVRGRIIDDIAGSAQSTSWAILEPAWGVKECALCVAKGFPRSVTFHQDRLCWAGSATFPLTVWCSATGDYENHAIGTSANDAFSFGINARDVSLINFIESQGDALVIGASNAEYVALSSSGALSLSTVTVQRQTNYGSAYLQPIIVDSALVFAERKEDKIRQFSFRDSSQSYQAGDLTQLNDTILDGGITQLAHSRSPLSIVWAVRADGELVGLLLERNVAVGWFTLADATGTYESVAVIPHPSGQYDQIWVVTNRTIDGGTKRYIEVFEPIFDDSNLAIAHHVDSGLSNSFGAAVNSLTGLDHLEGETVVVVSNAVEIGSYTVSSGAVSLGGTNTAIGNTVAGLEYNPSLTLLPWRAQIGAGAQAQIKSIGNTTFRVYRSQGLSFGPDASTLQDLVYTDTDTVFTGDISQQFPGYAEESGQIVVVQDEPFPATILAIMPEIELTSGSVGGF
jgi:hypothetical protein